MDACVALCEKSGVALSLVTGPTSMMMLYNVENYQGAVDFYTQYAEDHNLNYYNLNYLRGREEFLPDTLMHDYNHVNGEGAYAISRLYSEILKKDAEGTDTSGYFYKDLTALKADVNRIVAVGANVTLEGKNQARIEIVSLQNDDVTPNYRIELSQDDGLSYAVAVEWTQNSTVDIAVSTETDYTIKIMAKRENSETADAYQIYEGPR